METIGFSFAKHVEIKVGQLELDELVVQEAFGQVAQVLRVELLTLVVQLEH